MTVRRSLIAALALTALLAACGGGSDPSPAQTTAQATQAACPTAGAQTVNGGHLSVPPGAKAGRTPLLVMVIPGGDGDRNDRLGLTRAARKIGFAVLYPTSEDGGFWQLNDAQGTSDVTAVNDTITSLLETGCYDKRRVSITGVSNGAGFSARMACEHPELFAAVAPVAAGYKALDPCPASARMSFLDIHGTADTVVPYNGVPPDRKGSVPRNTARWAKRNGCSSRPRVSTPRRLVTHTVYRGCDAGLRVEAFKLAGTDHGWPGHKGGRLPRRNPSGLNATTEVLRFVRTARKPAS